MAITITQMQRENGPACNHLLVTVNDEGTIRTFRTSFAAIDALVAGFDSPLEAQKALVLLWAAYRRNRLRPILNVDIA